MSDSFQMNGSLFGQLCRERNRINESGVLPGKVSLTSQICFDSPPISRERAGGGFPTPWGLEWKPKIVKMGKGQFSVNTGFDTGVDLLEIIPGSAY